MGFFVSSSIKNKALADTTSNIYYCYYAITKPKARTTTCCTTCTKAHMQSVQQQFIIATGLLHSPKQVQLYY